MIQTLKNDLLTVTIDSFGAEIQSIENNRTQYQYLWHGDKKYWGRRSPVLFPLVGSVWNGTFKMDGCEYHLGQHGFARDNDFEVISDCPEDEAWFGLEYSDKTLALYPRRFRLEIGYRLNGERIEVMWKVRNLDDKPMSFHIGAHPAFNYPAFNSSDDVHAYFSFGRTNLKTQIIEEKGCVGSSLKDIVLDSDNMLPVDAKTFGHDALIIADRQVGRVSMLGKDKKPYLSVLFKAPLVGLWSPKPDAPFVCIEPWWGRCDRVGFKGDFSEREYTNTIQPGDTFEASYMMIFEDL